MTLSHCPELTMSSIPVDLPEEHFLRFADQLGFRAEVKSVCGAVAAQSDFIRTERSKAQEAVAEKGGNPRQVVTHVDIANAHALDEVVKSKFPDQWAVCEELAPLAVPEKGKGHVRDTLDNTLDYANPEVDVPDEVGVLLAFYLGIESRLGTVYMPWSNLEEREGRGDWYYGSSNHGAYKNGVELELETTKPKPEVVYVNRATAQTDLITALISVLKNEGVDVVEISPSSTKPLRLLDGVANAMVLHENVVNEWKDGQPVPKQGPWDKAAVMEIYRGAGGHVCDLPSGEETSAFGEITPFIYGAEQHCRWILSLLNT